MYTVLRKSDRSANWRFRVRAPTMVPQERCISGYYDEHLTIQFGRVIVQIEIAISTLLKYNTKYCNRQGNNVVQFGLTPAITQKITILRREGIKK